MTLGCSVCTGLERGGTAEITGRRQMMKQSLSGVQGC